MGKIIVIVIIAIAAYFTYSESAQENFKRKALGVMQQEKTINTVNVKREADRKDVNNVLNR